MWASFSDEMLVSPPELTLNVIGLGTVAVTVYGAGGAGGAGIRSGRRGRRRWSRHHNVGQVEGFKLGFAERGNRTRLGLRRCIRECARNSVPLGPVATPPA